MDDVMGRTTNTLPSQFRHVLLPATTVAQFLRSDTDWTSDVTPAERYRRARVDAEFRTTLDARLTSIAGRHRSCNARSECTAGLALLYGLTHHVRPRRLLAALRAAFLPAHARRHLNGQCDLAGEHLGHARDSKPCARGPQPGRVR